MVGPACHSTFSQRTDIRKLKHNWSSGWRRVTFYGDHREAVETLAALLGVNVVLEG